MNRREFLRGSAGVSLAAISTASPALLSRQGRSEVGPCVFTPLPLGSIKPTGWLRKQLEIQAAGLSGHLDETWANVGPNSGWLGGTGESSEDGPYWLDGVVPLAYLLDDARLKAKVHPWIEWTLKSQDGEGNFGPKNKGNSWWPRMIMLKVLIQYQEATGDPQVIPFMERYFRYQLQALPAQPLASWAKYRWQDNVLSVLWLYDRNPDAKLLELANLLHSQGHNWREEFDHFEYTSKMTHAEIEANKKNGGYHETHGVDIAMGLKSGAVWSRVSRDSEDRDSATTMLALLDKYHGLPNGMYSADEHLAGRKPIQGTELCTVVEAMFSLEQALAASGDYTLADRLEKVAFNALPGGISYDMWSHQYDQQPNQIECSLRKRPWSNNGAEANLFGLTPNFPCCCANFSQGWPKFASSLWMKSLDGGLVAAVYAPSFVTVELEKTPITIETVTEYPFRNVVELHVRPETATTFPLKLRVPRWGAAKVLVNDKVVLNDANPGFVTLKRKWEPGDIVRVEFVMEPRVLPGYDNSLSVMRGPLVFSLPIEEKWNKLHDRGMTADWEILGQSAWNYALVRESTITVAKEQPVGDSPFGKEAFPVTLKASARQVHTWQAVDGIAGDFPQSVQTVEAENHTVMLVPYASTKLRITAFPAV